MKIQNVKTKTILKVKLLGIAWPNNALLLEYHIAWQKIKIDKVRLACQVLVLNRQEAASVNL